MSDQYYREKFNRELRLLLAVLGIAIVFTCVILFVINLFRDACTHNFDRSPNAIINSYIDAINRGDLTQVQECWQHDAYYDLAAGCSEICLSHSMGMQVRVLDIQLSPPMITEKGRANLQANILLACDNTGENHYGELILESVKEDLPWKHWEIIQSDIGGTVGKPWCKK